MTDINQVSRATSVAEWLERQAQNQAEHERGVKHGLSYRPQPTDVFIASYAKCGTTWLQQLEIKLDESLLEIVVKQSSFDFMLAHKDKFDDLLMRDFFVKAGMHPPGSDATKVRSGRVGDHQKELPADISQEMDDIWRKKIEVTLGLASYQALHEALIQENT